MSTLRRHRYRLKGEMGLKGSWNERGKERTGGSVGAVSCLAAARPVRAGWLPMNGRRKGRPDETSGKEC